MNTNVPASSIHALLEIVPMLIRRPPIILLRSDISSEVFDIMGEAPKAKVTFADCVVTTIFVIYTGSAYRVKTTVLLLYYLMN